MDQVCNKRSRTEKNHGKETNTTATRNKSESENQSQAKRFVVVQARRAKQDIERGSERLMMKPVGDAP